MSPNSTSYYGIRSHDDHDLRRNFMAPIDARSNTSFGEPFYPTPVKFDGWPAPSFPNPNISATRSHENLPSFLINRDTGLAPVFPAYNEVPRFQTRLPFTTSSQIFPGLPTSSGPENTSSSPSRPSHGNLSRSRCLSENTYTKRIAACLAKSKKVAFTRSLTRNTNKRQHGSGFGDMFDKLPLEVREALNTVYTGCCESTTDKDDCTRKKHMFSKRHCLNLPKEYLDMVPCFVCPAFVAFHKECKSAQGGRYDSTERHCKNCAGFQEMNSKFQMYPLKVTKEEYEAITTYRSNKKGVQVDEKTERLVESSVNKLLEMMMIDRPDSRGVAMRAISEPPDAV